jgi:SAM-dependent methyltransferase
MKFLDRVLQRWRISKAAAFIESGSRVLDLACADGALFRQLDGRIRDGMGIDPVLKANTQVGRFPLIAGWFPKDMPQTEPFDVITMLAVLEHIPDDQAGPVAHECARRLKPRGRLVITVPSSAVDQILKVLLFFRLIEGMSLEQHHGFDVRRTTEIFGKAGLALKCHRKFQLGLNNLFVFEKRD